MFYECMQCFAYLNEFTFTLVEKLGILQKPEDLQTLDPAVQICKS